MIRRCVIGLLLGCAITAVPILIMRLWDGFYAINVLLLPGIAIAINLSRNVHDDTNDCVLLGANVLVYASAIYLFLYLREKGKKEEPKPPAPLQ